MTVKLAVLASGRGSNFKSIQEAINNGALDARVDLLITDKEQAAAREIARANGIEEVYIPYDKNDRVSFEKEAERLIKEKGCDLVILAGFMRLITPHLIDAFAGRMLNIHPSLLPSFKGLHAQRQALEYGVKFAGCTVHFVTQEMDAGPIIQQRCVPVLPDDDEESLCARILIEEHALYPEAIRMVTEELSLDV